MHYFVLSPLESRHYILLRFPLFVFIIFSFFPVDFLWVQLPRQLFCVAYVSPQQISRFLRVYSTFFPAFEISSLSCVMLRQSHLPRRSACNILSPSTIFTSISLHQYGIFVFFGGSVENFVAISYFSLFLYLSIILLVYECIFVAYILPFQIYLSITVLSVCLHEYNFVFHISLTSELCFYCSKYFGCLFL